ncbi:MAG: RNA ligase family protein [Mariniblastus sp.]
MGTSRGDFYKYPRTPHLDCSKGTSDDKRLGAKESARLLADQSLIVEEKLDGTNVGLHFSEGELVLQCRGHEITAGMHPQYDLFKQWATTKRVMFEEMLGERFLIYGEWLYARHSVYYQQLPHYFFEFDIFDKQDKTFLSLETRLEKLEGSGIITVPVVHQGALSLKQLRSLVGPSQFESKLTSPSNGKSDDLMEGLYLRTEANDIVTARAKFVRPEFTQCVQQSNHWQHEAMVPNQLADSVDIWN